MTAVAAQSVVELRGAHRGAEAAVIFGGPSLIHHQFDMQALRRKGLVVFVESKALTPWLLAQGLSPDYFIMSFAEKCKDNGVQNFVFRAFLAGVNVKPLLRREHGAVVDDMRRNFSTYFEDWRPHKGPHKRYRWKPNVFLKDSPIDLLARLPQTRVIANGALQAAYFPALPLTNPLFLFEQGEAAEFDLNRYYQPAEDAGTLTLCGNPFLNSAAIALYPLLTYMGFRRVYLLGMDMSNLGSLEYAAPYTFRSMLHFRWFVYRAHRAFNGNYRMNRPFYLRPRSEFDDLKTVLGHAPASFVRVHAPFRYAAEVEGLPSISLKDFERQSERTS